jgi:hypothetical protein
VSAIGAGLTNAFAHCLSFGGVEMQSRDAPEAVEKLSSIDDRNDDIQKRRACPTKNAHLSHHCYGLLLAKEGAGWDLRKPVSPKKMGSENANNQTSLI